jgi:hypothetical protein
MKSPNLLRNLGLVGLTVVAIGGLGVLLGSRGGGSTSSSSTAQSSDGGFAWPADTDQAIASIDKTLGRESTVNSGIAQLASAPKPNDNVPRPIIASEKAPAGAGGGLVPAAPATTSSTTTKSDGSPGTDVNPVSGLDDRKIVQTASLKLQVKDVGGGFQDVSRIASAAGGFVASSNFAYQGEVQVASLTVKVPADKYQDVLAQLRGTSAKIDSETSSGSDVTDEYADLGARMRNLQATEAQLLTLLGSAKNITEVLQVQDRLNTVRGQIEQARGRQVLLDKLSDLATISVSLRPVVVPVKQSQPSGDSLGARASEAWDNSIDFLTNVTGGALAVIVFSWWLPIVAVPLVVAGKRLNRRHEHATALD